VLFPRTRVQRLIASHSRSTEDRLIRAESPAVGKQYLIKPGFPDAGKVHLVRMVMIKDRLQANVRASC
jgi:hypothetical protein